MGDNDNNEMQREWRAIVLSKLSSLETSHKDLNTNIQEIKTSFAKQQTIDILQGRVDELEKFKSKLVGFTLAFQVVWVIVTFLLYYFQGTRPK